MANLEALSQAVQEISPRLLKAGVRGKVMERPPTSRVCRAIQYARQNVHGVGVGWKIVNSQPTDTLCVCVYVLQKLPKSLIPPRDLLDKSLVGGLPIDVVECPPAFARAKKESSDKNKSTTPQADGTSKRRPIVAGISAAHNDVTAGTLGYFCRSTRLEDDPKQVYVLSNNHVFAAVNEGQIGDDLYQPSPLHGGKLTDHFAELDRFVSLVFDKEIPNYVDAAIGALNPDIAYTAEIQGIGKIQGTEAAGLDMEVCKHGAITGYTEGKVVSIRAAISVGFETTEGDKVKLKVARFENLIKIEPSTKHSEIGFAKDGDSGALVLSKSGHKAIGLIFSASPSGSYGLAVPIDEVQAKLEIELL